MRLPLFLLWALAGAFTVTTISILDAKTLQLRDASPHSSIIDDGQLSPDAVLGKRKGGSGKGGGGGKGQISFF